MSENKGAAAEGEGPEIARKIPKRPYGSNFARVAALPIAITEMEMGRENRIKMSGTVV